MLRLKTTGSKKAKILFTTLTVIGLSAFIAFQANALVDPGGDGYCKNDPHRNTGLCFKSTSGVFICMEAQGGTTNKDCYDVYNP